MTCGFRHGDMDSFERGHLCVSQASGPIFNWSDLVTRRTIINLMTIGSSRGWFRGLCKEYWRATYVAGPNTNTVLNKQIRSIFSYRNCLFPIVIGKSQSPVMLIAWFGSKQVFIKVDCRSSSITWFLSIKSRQPLGVYIPFGPIQFNSTHLQLLVHPGIHQALGCDM